MCLSSWQLCMLQIICMTYKDKNIKPVLWNHCHETPPVLKDHTCLGERRTFWYSRKCAPKTFQWSLVTGSLHWNWSPSTQNVWSFKIVALQWSLKAGFSGYLLEAFTSHHVSRGGPSIQVICNSTGMLPTALDTCQRQYINNVHVVHVSTMQIYERCVWQHFKHTAINLSCGAFKIVLFSIKCNSSWRSRELLILNRSRKFTQLEQCHGVFTYAGSGLLYPSCKTPKFWPTFNVALYSQCCLNLMYSHSQNLTAQW